MSQVSSQLAQDLAFVRAAVDRRQRQRPNLTGLYVVWAAYVLIGYTLIDLRPHWSNVFFATAWLPAAALAAVFRRRAAARGEVGDPTLERKRGMHFGLGIALAIAATVGLAMVIPALRGPASGQVCVCLIGIVYFMAGVHFDPRFLWLGPLMIVGALLVGVIPVLPWTTLGVVIAAGLVVPSLFAAKPSPVIADAGEVAHVES